MAAPLSQALEDAARPARNRWLSGETALRFGALALLVALPGVVSIAFDFSRRHAQLEGLTRSETRLYVGWALVSVLLWGSLVYVALARAPFVKWWARLLLLAGAALALGGQTYVFSRYGAYLDHRAALVGTSMLPSVGQQLWSDRWGFAAALAPPMLFALAVPLLARFFHLGRAGALFALDLSTCALLVAAFGNVGDDQIAPPGVLYVSAMGQLARAHWDHNETVERRHPGPRTPLAVPPVVPRPAERRNVLFVITESVRAQSTCVAYDPACKWTPFSNAATPHRFGLTQMRALDSTTAISLAVMWNGLPPTASRAALHSAPLVWEYAHAAGFHTAYWTSQNLLFGNSGTWLSSAPLDRTVSATQLEPDATMEIGADDGKLVDYVLGDLDHLPEPYVAVVHLSNTHFPYKVDDVHTPYTAADGPPHRGFADSALRRRYQDAIYLQDMAVGRLVRAVRARPEGGRTVIFFISDHGEQLREKGYVGHTFSLWDQEIRVPAWIDAPPGTLSPSESASLASLAKTPLTSLDVLPTLLDLMGVWKAPELAELERALPGHSLLRGGSPTNVPIAMSNCTELWACAFRNWGAMEGTRKVLAHEGDHAWGCYDVATDPDELDNLGPSACADLVRVAEHGRGRPF